MPLDSISASQLSPKQKEKCTKLELAIDLKLQLKGDFGKMLQGHAAGKNHTF